MNYGTDLKVKSGFGGGMHKAGKAAPRMGAAKGQGAGMGGYNASTVNKAMSSVKGSGGAPTYYCGGSRMGR
jgi:hypothetical protein